MFFVWLRVTPVVLIKSIHYSISDENGLNSATSREANLTQQLAKHKLIILQLDDQWMLTFLKDFQFKVFMHDNK